VAFCDGENTWCRELHSGTDRNRTRIMSTNHALDMIRRRLTGLEI